MLKERVIHAKQDCKAKLVVQGCQEDKGYIRTDAPMRSRDACFMTLAAAAQDNNVFDAQHISSRIASRDCCCGGCHTQIRLLGRSQGTCLWQLVQSTGREVLDVLGTSTSRKCSKPLGSWSLGWNKASTICMDLMEKASKAYKGALRHLVHTLHSKQQIGTWRGTWRGRVLWPDRFQGWQSHESEAGKVNTGSRACEH